MNLGYGFGLRASEHLVHGTTFSHSGGLPGYGSHFRCWGGQCALIVLANSTYFHAWALAQSLQDATLPKSQVPPLVESDELVIVLRRVLSLANMEGHEISEQLWDDLFSFNVLLDNPKAKAVVRSLAGHGIKRLISKPTSARGSFELVHLVKGTIINVLIMLTPETKPLVQKLILL